ncbi:uncharacterized protein [Littorina saxatilis]|uniref:Uncharacterized protein n=2 Tax=Littorina saxatilis TaxID=31220 RepID=A0AAN9B529_9CAEN
MKAVFLLAIVAVVAVLVPETEANFFRNLGRRVKSGVETVGRGVRTGVRTVGRGVRTGVRTVGRGVRTLGRGVTSFGRGLRRGLNSGRVDQRRGKRSASALTPDTVNALDKVSTFNLGLPVIMERFNVSDENKNAFLDGQEVLVFLGMIESLMGVNDQPQEPVIQ